MMKLQWRILRSWLKPWKMPDLYIMSSQILERPDIFPGTIPLIGLENLIWELDLRHIRLTETGGNGISATIHFILNPFKKTKFQCKRKNCRKQINIMNLSLIHISEPTRRTPISYAV